MDLLKDDIRKLYKAYLVPSLSAAVVTSVYSFADMAVIGCGVGPDGAAALSIATLFLVLPSSLWILWENIRTKLYGRCRFIYFPLTLPVWYAVTELRTGSWLR